MKSMCYVAVMLALFAVSIARPALADCDPVPGKKLFRPCLACHTAAADSGHLSGPNLYGLIGRRLGGAEGYVYSEPFLATELVWDEETLAAYLADPQGFLPGSRMMFSGVSERADSDAIACYVRTLSAERLQVTE